MSDKNSNPRQLQHLVFRIVQCLALGCSLLPCLAYAQAKQSQPDELATSIAKVQSGDFNAVHLEIIAKANAVKATRVLEEQFGRATDVDTKVEIANALVRLRDPDNAYWNYLLEQARLAVDSNVPDAVFSNSQAKMMRSTPELEIWADANKVSVKTAARYARFDSPTKVLQLATAGDPRGIPLLQQSLKSRNYLIVAFAAKGLAHIHDTKSIPLIIAAIQTAPAGYNSLIAEALVYFDDPQAQSVVDAFMPKAKAKLARDERARGRGVFGW